MRLLVRVVEHVLVVRLLKCEVLVALRAIVWHFTYKHLALSYLFKKSHMRKVSWVAIKVSKS